MSTADPRWLPILQRRATWLLVMLSAVSVPSFPCHISGQTQEPALPNAWLRHAARDPEASIELLSRRITESPADARLYARRAACYQFLLEHKKAIADYDRAIRLGLGDPMIYSNKGVAFYILGDFDQAIASYDQALAKGGRSFLIYRNRGLALFRRGLFPDAIADFSQAITLGDSEPVHVNRGMAFAKLGQTSDALADFAEAIARFPKNADAYSSRAFLLLDQLGLAKEAIEDFDYAIHLEPTCIDHYLGRAQAYRGLRMRQAFWKDLGKAASIAPGDPRVFGLAALEYLQSGSPEKAAKSFEHAIELLEKHGLTRPYVAEAKVTCAGRLYYDLGRAHQQRADPANARQAFERAVASFSVLIDKQPFDPTTYDLRALAYDQLGLAQHAQADRERGKQQRVLRRNSKTVRPLNK